MDFWKLIVFSLASLSFIDAFSCPDDNETLYHADIRTGCQVYHLCEGSEMTTLSCPLGEAFDYVSNQCQSQETVDCTENTSHLRHKRSEPQIMIHSISVQKIKGGAKSFSKSLHSLIEDTVKEVAPSIYSEFEAEYAPYFRKLETEVMPFINDKVKPRLLKAVTYAQNIGERVFEKVYKTWELSNSTHINLVSCSDIAQDLAKDIEPYLKLGKYLSSRLMQTHRVKRQAPREEIPELLMQFMEPMFSTLITSLRRMFTGEEDTLTSKVILPVFFDMAEDPETRFYLKRIMWSIKAAFAPIISDMLSQQTWDSPQGTVVKISKDQISTAWSRIVNEVKPLKRRILQKHLPSILRRAANNVHLILEAFDRLKKVSGSYTGILQDSLQRFVEKHYQVLRTSNASNVHSYSLTEILEDLRPIEMTVVQMFLEYLSKTPNSFLSGLFNRDSILYRVVMGDQSPHYAVPSYSS